MRTFELFCVVFWCLCAAAWASSSRQPCQSPSMTSGTLMVTSTGGHDIAHGDFSYDSTAKKLRFVESESHSNKTTHMDVLIHFEESVLFEIDSKNQSCKKETLKYRRHPMELPSDATHESETYLGSPSKSEQGLRVRMWDGKLPGLHANYTMLTTSCGCLTVYCRYHSEKTDLTFSFMNVETEVDDTQVFVPPAYCDGVALDDTPDDHSFFDLFHD
ncbi:ependymin-like [Astyanax mexicanus]|uniref:Ependymin-like n=1 Tax=Astyanax mexicanus TaxID=7994 RepID=A0A8B9RA08_ASTMX|nr:ependymin-like [Astyanax mexicanus]